MPAFLFGTGRCGSTHLQRLISVHTDTWIWGEHGGFLDHMFQSVRNFESSPTLQETVFEDLAFATDDVLWKCVTSRSYKLSWMNRWPKSKARRELAFLIERFFSEGVPENWRDWGFKEILYGLENDVPEQLMSMFPNARCSFTFREPRSTIESMLRTWSPELLADPPRATDLGKVVDLRVTRWMKSMRYFIALRERNQALKFLDQSVFKVDPNRMLATLGFNIVNRFDDDLAVTNDGPQIAIAGWAQDSLDERLAAAGSEIAELYERALSFSQADFDLVRT